MWWLTSPLSSVAVSPGPYTPAPAPTLLSPYLQQPHCHTPPLPPSPAVITQALCSHNVAPSPSPQRVNISPCPQSPLRVPCTYAPSSPADKAPSQRPEPSCPQPPDPASTVALCLSPPIPSSTASEHPPLYGAELWSMSLATPPPTPKSPTRPQRCLRPQGLNGHHDTPAPSHPGCSHTPVPLPGRPAGPAAPVPRPGRGRRSLKAHRAPQPPPVATATPRGGRGVEPRPAPPRGSFYGAAAPSGGCSWDPPPERSPRKAPAVPPRAERSPRGVRQPLPRRARAGRPRAPLRNPQEH